jgi:hypothetical protein
LISDREVIEFFSCLFRRVLASSLGESAAEALLSVLKRGLGREPSEIFWENPKEFYSGMEKTIGMGAEVLVRLLVDAINRESNLNMSPDKFIELMRSGNPKSIEEIRSILRRLVR